MLNGFMCPNYEWQDWTSAQLAQTIALNPTVLLIPLYEASNPFSSQKRFDIARLHEQLPNCTFLYRIMGENNMLRDAVQWAAESKARVAGLPPGDIIPTNEDNLEGMGENWEGMKAWWLAYLAQMSGFSVHLSALSPNGNYYHGWEVLESLASRVSAVDIHIYPGNEGDLSVIGSYFTGNTIYVTEYNRIMPTSMAAQAKPYAKGIVWFILDGTADQKQYALVEPYLSDFKKVNSMPTPTFNVGPGVLALMKTHSDTPTSDEHYLKDTNGVTFMSVTRGHKGKYEYDFQSNVTAFFPFG